MCGVRVRVRVCDMSVWVHIPISEVRYRPTRDHTIATYADKIVQSGTHTPWIGGWEIRRVKESGVVD